MLGLGVSKSMSLATTMTRDVTGGPTAESWQGVLNNDLGKCPASKLVPTMKVRQSGYLDGPCCAGLGLCDGF